MIAVLGGGGGGGRLLGELALEGDGEMRPPTGWGGVVAGGGDKVMLVMSGRMTPSIMCTTLLPAVMFAAMTFSCRKLRVPWTVMFGFRPPVDVMVTLSLGSCDAVLILTVPAGIALDVNGLRGIM